jgi:hypothetical protein
MPPDDDSDAGKRVLSVDEKPGRPEKFPGFSRFLKFILTLISHMKNEHQYRRAVAYLRSAGKGTGSIAIQQVAVEEYCKKAGITLLHISIDEGVSGRSLNRPGLKHLLNNVAGDPDAPVFTYVIAYDRSRIARNAMLLYQIEKRFRKLGKRMLYLGDQHEEED